MISQVLKIKFSWLNWLLVSLMAIVSAETIFIWGRQSFVAQMISALPAVGKTENIYFLIYVCIVIVPLAFLSCWYVYITSQLMRGSCEPGYKKALDLIERQSFVFGILGTVLGDIFLLKGLDPSKTRNEILSVLLTGGGSSLGSAAYGMVVIALANFTEFKFSHLLKGDESHD